MTSTPKNKEQTLLKPSDLVLLDFQFKIETGGYKIYAGHRLRVQLSEKSIRIRMMNCSCPLVHVANYSVEDMKAFLRGLKTEGY
jgi:hypothetical protein